LYGLIIACRQRGSNLFAQGRQNRSLEPGMAGQVLE
jgi:hypothetical protein